MTSDESERVLEVFADALDQPESERAAFLTAVCGSDADLRSTVEQLLRAHTESATFALGLEPDTDEITSPPGTKIGRYQILDLLGEGGFGVVYRAEQLEPIRRQVALKVIKPGMDSREVIARFGTERQALALMDHPGIARVLEAGTTGSGRPYFAMELVSGVPITEYCDEHTLGPDQRLRLFVEVCRAVQHAHQKAVIHRDLKPTNILVEELDGRPVPKIIDFGVAKALGWRLTGRTLVSRGERLLGTPAYMSPEQAEGGRREVDTRSDVYSLGVLLYELLTGTTPLDKNTLNRLAPDEVRRIVCETEPPKPSSRLLKTGDQLLQIAQQRRSDPDSLRKRLRGDLDWIVMKALEKDPQRRYDTASALAQDIERHLVHEPVLAHPPSPLYGVRKLVRRHRLTFAAAAVFTMTIVLGALVSTWQWRRAVAAQAFARRQAYAADMNLAQRALAESDFGRASELLRGYRPEGKSEVDLRGWDWRYLWTQARRDHSEVLLTASNFVESIAASADGRWLVVQEESVRITLRELPGGRRVGQLSPDRNCFGLALSRTGELLATVDGGDAAHVVRLWEVPSLSPRGVLPHPGRISTLALSPDGRLLAVHLYSDPPHGSWVLVWDVETQREARRFPASGFNPLLGFDTALAFHPAGDQLAFGGFYGVGGRITLFNLRTGQTNSLERPTASDGVSTLDYSPDGRTLAAGHAFNDTRIHLWDTDTGQHLRDFDGHTACVSALAFTPDGRNLVSAGFDQTIRIWDVPSGTLRRTLLGHTERVTGVAVLPDNRTLVTGSYDHDVRLWDLARNPPATEPTDIPVGYLPFQDPFAFAPDGGSFAILETNRSVVVRDARTTEVKERIDAFVAGAGSLAVSPDGRLLVAGGPGPSLQVWDLIQHQFITNASLAAGSVGRVSFAARGHLLRIEARSPQGVGRVHLWDTRDWREWRSYDLPFYHDFPVAWSTDGRWAALGDFDGSVAWWEADTGRSLAKTPGPFVTAPHVVFSPDDQALVASSWLGRNVIWDARQRRVNGPPLRGHRMFTDCACFAPGGQLLATGGDVAHQAVKLWDFSTRSELLTLKAPGGMIQNLTFSPDGNTLLALSADPEFHVYHWWVPSLTEIDATEAR